MNERMGRDEWRKGRGKYILCSIPGRGGAVSPAELR
jgi:hypothetical protein